MERALIAFLALACGLSPFFYGFYSLSVWGPIALGLLAALLGLVIARPAMLRPSAVVALSGLLLLWAWSLLSTQWAESSDQALTDSNRWLLYLALFSIAVLLLRDDRLGKLLLAAATAAIVGLGLYLCVRMLSGDTADLFLGRRVSKPLGYVNGQAGYLLLGLWPLIAVAERARSHLAAGAALSAATLLCGLVLLSQTRAVMPAVLVSLVVLVAVVPGRKRRMWAILTIVAGIAAAAAPLIDVYQTADPTTGPDVMDLRNAVEGLLLAVAAVGVIWGVARAAAGLADERLGARSAGIASTIGLCLVLGPLAIAGIAFSGRIEHRVSVQAKAFTELRPASAEGGSRFISGSGNRYDYWRIAWDEFRDEPFHGVGAGNYDRSYFLERKTNEDIRQPHSLPLQALSDLGVVGGLALLLFVGGVFAGFVRRVRAKRRRNDNRGLAVAGGGMFIVWFVHTSVDWLHLIPGVTGVALFGAAVLVAPWSRDRAPVDRSRVRVAVTVVCTLGVMLGAILLGRATLADKYRVEAQSLVADHPRAALGKAADSLKLNDEALPAYYVRASAYARQNDYQRARATLLQATRKEPHDFVTWGLLGDLAVRRGDLAAARAAYGRASRLNPRNNGLRRVARDPRLAQAK